MVHDSFLVFFARLTIFIDKLDRELIRKTIACLQLSKEKSCRIATGRVRMLTRDVIYQMGVSWGHSDLMSRGHSDLISEVCSEPTFARLPSRTFRGRLKDCIDQILHVPIFFLFYYWTQWLNVYTWDLWKTHSSI